MAKGFKHGSAVVKDESLSFDVKAYPSEVELVADKPSRYTIGVITTTTITGWVFDLEEPTEPEVGMVWFTTGETSTVEFNAITKNAIQVCPVAGKQYVSGDWTELVVKSYVEDTWVDWAAWDGLFFDNGKQFEEYTGGWKTVGTANIVEVREDCLYLEKSSVAVVTVNTVDTRNYTTLHFLVHPVSLSGDYDMTIGLAKNNTAVSSSNWHVYASQRNKLNAGVEQEITVDTTAYKGDYYISASTYAGIQVRILKVWMT